MLSSWQALSARLGLSSQGAPTPALWPELVLGLGGQQTAPHVHAGAETVIGCGEPRWRSW
jgi:hypothetical protein